MAAASCLQVLLPLHRCRSQAIGTFHPVLVAAELLHDLLLQLRCLQQLSGNCSLVLRHRAGLEGLLLL